MKTKSFISIIFFLYIGLVSCQKERKPIQSIAIKPPETTTISTEHTFTVTKEKDPSRDSSGQMIFNNQGVQVGNYDIKWKNDYAYGEVTLNGKKIKTGAYASVGLSGDNKNIVFCSDGFGGCTPGDVYLEIYSVSGRLIKERTLLCQQPFMGTTTHNGNMFYAGTDPKTKTLALVKLDNNGNEKWRSELSQDMQTMHFMSASESENFIAISNNPFGSLEENVLSIYNNEGRQLHVIEGIGPSHAAKFINDEYLIVCNTVYWYIFDIKQNFKQISTGFIKGRLTRSNHLMVFEEQNLALVGSIEDQPGKLTLQLIDIEKGVSGPFKVIDMENEYYFIQSADIAPGIKRLYSSDYSFLIDVD